MKTTWRKFLAGTIAAAMMMGLAACGGTASSSSQPAQQSEAGESSQVGEVGTGGADRGQQLVIYSNSVSEGRGEWLEEKAAAAGFDIAWVDIGGAELTERLIAEKNNQIADLVFGLNAMNFERLKAADVLAPYTPEWAGEVDQSLGDDEGYFWPIVLQALIIVYNSNEVDAADAPANWLDLLDEKYSDVHTILSLGGGTCQSILAGILVRYTDPDGEYGISEEGWAVMKQYLTTGHVVADGEDWWGNVMDGTRPISQLWGSGLLQRYNEYEADHVAYANHSDGTPFVVEQVGICAGSDKQDLAKEFIDWFGTAEIQGEWAATFDSYPANTGAQGYTSEAAQAMMNSVKAQDIDWGFVAENIEYWMEKIQLEFV